MRVIFIVLQTIYIYIYICVYSVFTRIFILYASLVNGIFSVFSVIRWVLCGMGSIFPVSSERLCSAVFNYGFA